jgi:hypothetical protein
MNDSRRHFLAIAAGAVAACAGLAMTALPALADVDPIFAAFDAHRAACAAFDTAFHAAWLRNGYGGGPSISAECDVLRAAIDRVIDTAPTTRAGLNALSGYLAEGRGQSIAMMIDQRLQEEGILFEDNPYPWNKSVAFFIARRAAEIDAAA